MELLRREPLRLGVLVPHERAALLVFRLLTAGAEVHVRSPHPQVWARLLRTSGADPARLVVGLPGGATPPPGGPLRPVVVVDEFTGSCGAPRPDLGAWQIGISLHHRAPAAPAPSAGTTPSSPPGSPRRSRVSSPRRTGCPPTRCGRCRCCRGTPPR
ncbi:hypothetical protein [Streptomyces clavuligerus]|uniref:hypothetical protein n=1 Tax=Streptomyces clavuligerus TaxID=1901 RepID=UPI001E3F7227|nr:hypothetical protein [Streptomyces clavuligerus]